MFHRLILVAGVLLCSWPLPVLAQSIGVGVRASAQTTTLLSIAAPFPQYAVSESRATVGPTFEFSLPRHLVLEASALRKRLSYKNTVNNSTPISGGTRTTRDTTATSWEIPLLLKWHARDGRVSPLIGGGLSLRHVGGSTHAYGTSTTGSIGLNRQTIAFDRTENISELHNGGTLGIVSSGGLSIRAGFLHFSPELRYTRWANSAFKDPQPTPQLTSKPNQFEVLVGITFWNRN